jgi:hypothetical protein
MEAFMICSFLFLTVESIDPIHGNRLRCIKFRGGLTGHSKNRIRAAQTSHRRARYSRDVPIIRVHVASQAMSCS